MNNSRKYQYDAILGHYLGAFAKGNNFALRESLGGLGRKFSLILQKRLLKMALLAGIIKTIIDLISSNIGSPKRQLPEWWVDKNLGGEDYANPRVRNRIRLWLSSYLMLLNT